MFDNTDKNTMIRFCLVLPEIARRCYKIMFLANPRFVFLSIYSA